LDTISPEARSRLDSDDSAEVAKKHDLFDF
jgi:hypothetical protein